MLVGGIIFGGCLLAAFWVAVYLGVSAIVDPAITFGDDE